MGFSRWDAFLKQRFNGLFHGRLGGVLEPAGVEQALEQELLRRRRKGRRGAYVPNAFEIHVGTEDHQRLSSRRFLEDLHVFLEKVLILSNCFMDGKLSIRLIEVPETASGHCDITSCFVDDKEEAFSDEESGGTLVLERSSFAVPLNLPPNRLLATLTVSEGPDRETSLKIGEKKIYIGRRRENEMVLTDGNASRLHAYIAYERHRHVLHDAGSLNGTFLNGERVEEAVLQDGDEIRAGATLLLYEVL